MASSIERARHTQCSHPGLLLACICRIPCSLHVAHCNQIWKLFLLARPHIRKRQKVLYCFCRIFKGASEPNLTRILVHQAQAPQQGSTPRQHQSAPCRKVARTLLCDRTHHKSLHGLHGPLLHLLLQRQPLHNFILPC